MFSEQTERLTNDVLELCAKLCVEVSAHFNDPFQGNMCAAAIRELITKQSVSRPISELTE